MENFEKNLRISKKEENQKKLDSYEIAIIDKIITEKVNEKVKSEIRLFFQKIGYDIDDYKDIRRLSIELDYLKNARLSSENNKSVAFRSIITSTIGGLLGVLFSILFWFLTHGK